MSSSNYNTFADNKLSGRDKEITSKLARISTEGFVTVAAASEALSMPTRKVAGILSRLEKKGWIRRVRRGIYFMLPLEATKQKGGIAGDPWIVASVLFNPCYIGGWSAAEHWELTEQLFQSTFVVTESNERSSTQDILGAKFKVVRVGKPRTENSVEVWRGTHKVKVSSPEQTIIDGCMNPSWVGGFRHLYDITETYLSSDRSDVDKLVNEALRRRKGVIYKRLGYLIHLLLPENTKLQKKLRQKISRGLIKLDPGIEKKGKVNYRWGVWVNSMAESDR